MKILITGGLGFIGSNLLNLLIKKKDISKIIIVDNQTKSDLSYINTITKYKYYKNKNKYQISNHRVVVIKADIIDFKFARTITKNINSVIHLAAESGVDVSIKNPKKSFDVNVRGTFNYLESCRLNNVNSFIFASSGAVFGNAKPPMDLNTQKNPISPYGSSKLSVESFCETFSLAFDIKTTILRFSNAYGPYSSHKKSVVANFINNIIDNKPLIINGDGKHTRDYIYAQDICDAIYKSLKLKNKFNIFHISTGIQTSIFRLLDIIKNDFSKYNIDIPIIRHVKNRVGDMRLNSMTPSSDKINLRWKKSNKLDSGISKTIFWFINR